MIERVRAAIVGLGQHGSGIASLLLQRGHKLVGVVDVGDKVGQPIKKYVSGADSELLICGTVEDLLSKAKPEVVVLTAAISPVDTAAQAAVLMGAGINCVTLQEEMLVPDPAWADGLDKIGKTTGASFLSTGAQDTWWIHLPGVIAGGSCNVSLVEVIANVDADDLPTFVGDMIGIGMTQEEFAKLIPMFENGPAILGQPLQEAAKAMRLMPLKVSNVVVPVIGKADMLWKRAEKTVKGGRVLGLSQTTEFDTDRGVRFRGVLTTALVPGGSRLPDKVVVHGTPKLTVELPSFPGMGVTNAAVVNRIPDVIAAPGGVLSATRLMPARYHM